jgi:hypothetical protein
VSLRSFSWRVLTLLAVLSLALNRGTFVKEANSTSDKNLGIIAFGGIAPVPITNTTVTVPIEGFKVFGFNGPVQQFYTIDVDEFVFEGSNKRSKKTPAFLDSGTWYNWVPQSVAKDFNANWKPAAKFDPDQGVYYVRGFSLAQSGDVHHLVRCRATRRRPRSRS